jgi:hypothetical protein
MSAMRQSYPFTCLFAAVASKERQGRWQVGEATSCARQPGTFIIVESCHTKSNESIGVVTDGRRGDILLTLLTRNVLQWSGVAEDMIGCTQGEEGGVTGRSGIQYPKRAPRS